MRRTVWKGGMKGLHGGFVERNTYVGVLMRKHEQT
jgi:hypothetical protein